MTPKPRTAEQEVGTDSVYEAVASLRHLLEIYLPRPRAHAESQCRLGKCEAHVLLDEIEAALLARGGAR